MESLQVRERSNRTQRWSFVSRLETNETFVRCRCGGLPGSWYTSHEKQNNMREERCTLKDTKTILGEDDEVEN